MYWRMLAAPAPARICSQARANPCPLAMPYIDINPHRSGPRWRGYLLLAILLLLTAAVVAAALHRG